MLIYTVSVFLEIVRSICPRFIAAYILMGSLTTAQPAFSVDHDALCVIDSICGHDNLCCTLSYNTKINAVIKTYYHYLVLIIYSFTPAVVVW
jgi:hypothetical protein